MVKMLLSDFSVDNLFNPVEIGVDETLYIVNIDYIDSLNYGIVLILENEYGLNVKVKFPLEFNEDINDYSIGNSISVKGILKLDTEDLFYLTIEEVINYGINTVEVNVSDDEEDIIDVCIQRNDPKVRQWREAVIRRDKVCRCCGGEKHLEAHHIFSWHDYPDMRVNIDNGVTLCSFCHHRYNSYFGHKGTGIGIIDFLDRFKCR